MIQWPTNFRPHMAPAVIPVEPRKDRKDSRWGPALAKAGVWLCRCHGLRLSLECTMWRVNSIAGVEMSWGPFPQVHAEISHVRNLSIRRKEGYFKEKDPKREKGPDAKWNFVFRISSIHLKKSTEWVHTPRLPLGYQDGELTETKWKLKLPLEIRKQKWRVFI